MYLYGSITLQGGREKNQTPTIQTLNTGTGETGLLAAKTLRSACIAEKYVEFSTTFRNFSYDIGYPDGHRCNHPTTNSKGLPVLGITMKENIVIRTLSTVTYLTCYFLIHPLCCCHIRLTPDADSSGCLSKYERHLYSHYSICSHFHRREVVGLSVCQIRPRPLAQRTSQGLHVQFQPRPFTFAK